MEDFQILALSYYEELMAALAVIQILILMFKNRNKGDNEQQ